MRYSDINENYSPDRDKHNSIELDDTRKKRLTLTHLNDLRKSENTENMKILKNLLRLSINMVVLLKPQSN